MKRKHTSPRKGSGSARSPKSVSSRTTHPATRSSKSKTAVGKQIEASPAPVRQPKSISLGSLRIPPILLEGDVPPPAPPAGASRRYAVGPTPPVEEPTGEARLPEAYGTRQLLLVARDPHWLYAHWDFTRDQQRHYNLQSADHHLVLRVYIEKAGDQPAAEIHVHPESRHWFVHVDRAATRYVAILGFYTESGAWKTLSTSSAAFVPSDQPSAARPAEFATLSPPTPLPKLHPLIEEVYRRSVPLAIALEQLRAEGHPELARLPAPSTPTPATTVPEIPFTGIPGLDVESPFGPASMEFASLAAAAPGSVSSPPGPVPLPAGKGFWFNVNTDLIVYGATEPNATVTVGGRAVKLRPDGSFSCRFFLPDGQYELSVVAMSADQANSRAAELKISRGTEFRGEVGAAGHEVSLSPASRSLSSASAEERDRERRQVGS